MKHLYNRLFGYLFILTLFFGACSVKKEKPSSDFVTVDGIRFVVSDTTYSYVGTNFWYGAYLGQAGELGNRERLKKELDFLVGHGITNLRVMGASEESVFDNSLDPVYINEDVSYNDDLLIGLDYLLAEMDKRGMKAVIFLNNYWEWSGGMSTYQSWYSDQEAIDPADGDWPGFMDFSAEFYKNEEANRAWRDYIEQLIKRENTITGKPYYEDPAIMAWQLANEPRPGQGEITQQKHDIYVEWVEETAAFIKSHDPNHLVSTGSEGEMGSLNSMDIFVDAHDSEYIDYLTFHMWAKNWSWIDPYDMEGTYQNALDNAAAYIESHVAVADSLNKPIVMEEFGFPRDGESYERNSPVQYRNLYYEMVFEKVEQYEAFAGSNFWSWGGFGEAQNEDFWWQPGDPFTGDPPQEPQGLNSVFADDSTTLQIIKNHAENL
ncbi:glycoside hydrolase 5 family protein [Gracilimonas mengyeensis]|uniref:mannan endo-1,4-beta-mannosidase n=1 Tax=Gracilimonas mengyeensis TaxID=1302730 RepID=A0A521AHI6_9BACT|nr:hypothetical protein [Gracilimonas mengyeensis]SMO34269.1 mannan endo-1,4-beta-mannosidase [Gracilimonas mengyeensis]